MFTFYSFWSSFASSYMAVYFPAVLFLFILSLFRKDWRNELINWTYVFNCIVFWITLLGLLNYVLELFMAWYGQNPYEWYAYSTGRSNIFSPYGWSYWLLLFINYLLPLLYGFKKCRKNLPLTLIVAFVLSSGLWFERLVVYITSLYRDYLPSTWSTYYNNSFSLFFLNLIYFIVTSSLFYFLLHKKKKLPFSSAILSNFLFFIPYS